MLPPPVMAGDPGSFAESVVLRRHPAIVRQVRDAHPYPLAVLDRLDALLAEVSGGLGLDRPFLDAEHLFYTRLLDAVGFTGTALAGLDPFAPQKAAELARVPPKPGRADEAQLWLAALLGNRADLGFGLITEPADEVELLADDGPAVRAHLRGARPGPVVLVADNAGAELAADLLLLDHLLHTGAADRVALHLKAVPWFVSDATTADLFAVLDHLAGSDPGRRLAAALREGRADVVTHPFDLQPLDWSHLPGDLAAEFAAARLVIVKGDLNYRRLVGDRHWPVDAAFAELTRAVPGSIVAVRTLKSDVVVGLDRARAAALDTDTPGWRTSGRFGIIQFRAA